MPRHVAVSCALPYANGPLHLGHLVGYIQGDIWVRARRMAGDAVRFVCADDTHGTPIMLAAEKAGMTPERSSPRSRRSTNATSPTSTSPSTTTTRPTRRPTAQLTEAIYAALDARGHIARRSVAQFYDPAKGMFLPDRYIKGICPNCGTPDQYGDNCENCGATYAPTDLKEPRSVLSGATPELRESEHFFFEVGHFSDFLRGWLAGDVAIPGVKAKLLEWLDAEGGLRAWDISRDAPYFGFQIPGHPGKYFYVWLDAPIGYLSRAAGAVRARRRELHAVPRARQRRRAAPLHRQGHRQLPRPVLAGGAARRGLPRADAAARQRLPHRRRREDVEVARHLRHGAHLPRRRAWIPKRCATTSPRSPAAASTTST